MGSTEARRAGRIALFVAGIMMLATVAALSFTSSAAAQPCDPYAKPPCKPIVKPTVIRTDHGRPDDDEVVIPNRQERGPLPFTGADLTLFAATGFAAVGTGTILVRATRSRRSR
jgi:hypothetical protein